MSDITKSESKGTIFPTLVNVKTSILSCFQIV